MTDGLVDSWLTQFTWVVIRYVLETLIWVCGNMAKWKLAGVWRPGLELRLEEGASNMALDSEE